MHLPGKVEDLGGASLVSSAIAGNVDARGKSLTSISRAPKSLMRRRGDDRYVPDYLSHV